MSWLKDRWEEVTAQVKMGDNRTASTVRAARAKAAPATTRVNTNQPGWSVRKPQQSLTTQQRIDQSYGGGFSGIKNRVIDTFDANTEADRIKRFARTGLNENYEQQDAGLRKQRIESELKASEAKRDAGGYSNYAPTKAANTVMSGAIRSIHGIGQGMGGLVDLVTPGKGTNRLTDFTKDYGEVWDKKREHAGVNKTAYQLAQLPMTLYGYSVGDKAITGTAQLAAKGISAIPKVGAIVPKVAGAVDTISKSKPMVSAATKLDDIALNGTRAQRVGAKLAQSYAKPGTMGNITALNTLQNAGERSSRGQDNNWGTFATDIATGLAMQGGLNLAGQAGAGVVRGVSNRIIEPTTNLVQRGKSELATGLNTINRGANQHTPYTQLVPTESGRQIVSPRDSGRVIRENFDEISEKTRARIQAAREKVPERFKLNKYGGSNADFDSPTIRNDLTGEVIPNPAYRGKNVDPLESLKQEARTINPESYTTNWRSGVSNGYTIKPTVGKTFSDEYVANIKEWYKSQGYDVTGSGTKLDITAPPNTGKAEYLYPPRKLNQRELRRGDIQDSAVSLEPKKQTTSNESSYIPAEDSSLTQVKLGEKLQAGDKVWENGTWVDVNKAKSVFIKDGNYDGGKGVYRTQSQPPKSTPVQKVDPLESLKQEARKYKSAEEFRKNLVYNDNIIIHQTGKSTADKIKAEGFKSGKETGLGEKRSEVYGMTAYDWNKHSKFTKDTYARDGSDVAEVAIDTKGLKIADRTKQKFTDEEYVKGIHKQIPDGYDGVKVGYGNGVNEVLLKPEVASARRFNIDDLYTQSQPPKSTPVQKPKGVAPELKPTKLYHGTNAKFDKFDPSKIGTTTDDGLYGRGFYFSNDKAYAKQAPRGGAKNVMEVDANIENPLDLSRFKTKEELADYLDMSPDALTQDAGGFVRPTQSQINQFTSHVQERGHDAVHIPYSKNGAKADEFVVFDPNKLAPQPTKKPTPFEQNLQTAGLAPQPTKGATPERANGLPELQSTQAAQRLLKKQGIDWKKPKSDPLESLKQEASVFRSEAPNRYGIGQAELGSGLYTGSREIAGRTVDGKVVTDGLYEYKVNPKANILDSSSDVFKSIDAKASNDTSLKGLDGRAWQQRKADLVADLVKQQGYDGVRRGSNQVVAMSDKALIPVSKNAPVYTQSQPPKSTAKTVEAKPPTPFEQNLQTAGLAPKKSKGLVVSETKPLNGQKIQKVRTAPGEVEQRVVQDRSDEIADALGIPAKDRVPTTDSQRAERVDTAAQNGLENIKNNPEIVRQAAAPSTLKDKTKRKTFEEATKKYLGGTRSAEIERQATIASLNKEFKLSDKEKINAIISRDDPSVPALNEKVMRYNDRFKQLTDVAYKSYTDQGVKMGYVSSYLPRIYKNPKTGQEVDLPEFKALIQGSKRMKGREAEKVAVDWLVEKDPTKLLERYYKSMDNAVAGRQYMKDLEDNGLVTASTEPVRGMRPVIAEGLQTDGKVFYAQKDVAHKLNELFGSKEATNLVEKTLEKGAGVNSLFQSFVLSGGVPNTPINAFGMMQLLKEGMALHPIKAGRAFFGGGLSKSYANKVFTAKKDVMKLMAENDLDIRVNLEQTGKWGSERIKDAFKNEGKAAGLNQAWNEFTNDATFGRFMPMLEVLHFENVYKHQLKGGLIRKPKSSAEAARIAAESTKNFYGKTSVYKTSTRSKAVDDAAGALLFAPRFRESMVNFWVKNAKALVPTNYGKAEYRDNQKFMVASAVMYAAMTMLNEAMNGARMDENPDGKKDKLIMPASVAGKFGIDTKGKDIAVPFLPSIATVPRNLASLGANLATGKFNEAGKNAKAFASMPVKTVGDILTNEDYFGNKIVQDDSSPLQKFTQAASYVASSNMQPWIREALNVKGQKWDKETKKTWGIKEKSTFETLSNAGELPLRFYKPDTYRYGENWTPKGGKDEKFNFKQQRERAALGGEIKNISKTLKLNKRQDELFKSLSSVEFNDDGTLKEDNNPFYKSQRYTALQDDGVFEAMKQKSKLNAKLNGKPIDPIFSDDLAPDQRRVLLWKKTLPPGTSDPTVKKLYEQDWYQDYRNKESAYFDSKKAWNKKMGYKDATPNTNEYPVASKEVEDAQNAYFALPKGTGDRSSFIRNNPEIWNKMIAFWDSKDAWTNGERSKLGLGAVDDEDSGGFSYGSKRSSKRGGRGSKGGSKYDYTKNLFASSSDSASTSKQLRAILQKAMSGKS